MPPQFDAIGVGSCAVDHLALVDAYPQPDTKNRMQRMHVEGGGTVATALVTLARLGAKVSYLGKLGQTPLAQAALRGFAAEGVDTSHVIRTDPRAGPYFAFVLADQGAGQRTIWHTGQDVRHIAAEEVSQPLIASAKALLIEEYEPDAALQAARWARRAGVLVELDIEDPANDKAQDLIRLTDVLIVPEAFASGFTGHRQAQKAAAALKELGPDMVVVTQGDQGACCLRGDTVLQQPAFAVNAIDTTGCGDVFHGAFMFGLLRHWPLSAVAEFAAAVAALKSRSLGGRSGIPTRAEIAALLREQGSAEINRIMSAL